MRPRRVYSAKGKCAALDGVSSFPIACDDDDDDDFPRRELPPLPMLYKWLQPVLYSSIAPSPPPSYSLFHPALKPAREIVVVITLPRGDTYYTVCEGDNKKIFFLGLV